MSMMVSFVLSFFPRDVLDEILNLIESVSEDFLTTLPYYRRRIIVIVSNRYTLLVIISKSDVNQTVLAHDGVVLFSQ